MKTLQTLGVGLLLATSTIAQNNEQNTIHVRMVKNVNGIETIMDTVITDVNWDAVKIPDIEIDMYMDSILDVADKDLTILKTIEIQSIQEINDSLGEIFMQADMPSIDSIFQKYGIAEEHGGNGNRVIVISDDKVVLDNIRDASHPVEIRVVVQNCNIESIDDGDRKIIRSTDHDYNEKLRMDKAEFYPNPNNGKFHLGFQLEEKGDLAIHIFNSEGKQVYTERMEGFTGNYSNEIDISNQPAGVYYIKVSQGKRSWYKKMVLQ